MLRRVGREHEQQLDGLEGLQGLVAIEVDTQQVGEHASEDARRTSGLQDLRQHALQIRPRRTAAGSGEGLVQGL